MVFHRILTNRSNEKSSNKKVKPEIIELNNLEVKVLSND